MNAPAANNPPPPPPPPPPIFINLDLLTGSNGLVTQQPRPAWNHTQIAGQDPRGHHYLDELSRKYSNTYGVNVQFNGLPQNCTLWWKPKRGRTNRYGTLVGDFFVYGHPRGRYTSILKFIVHLHSMINNVVPCPCDRCQ